MCAPQHAAAEACSATHAPGTAPPHAPPLERGQSWAQRPPSRMLQLTYHLSDVGASPPVQAR